MKETDMLADEFAACRKMLQAPGDENRQHLILEMLRTGECGGVRVGAMAARTNLSMPVVSRHLRILRDAGLIRVRREGTKNYDYFDADARAMDSLLGMLNHARAMMAALPERGGQTEEE